VHLLSFVSLLAATPCPEVPHLLLDVELDDDHRLVGTAEWTITNRETEAMGELHFALLMNAEEEPNPELSGLANAQGYFNAWEPARTDLGEITIAGAVVPWSYVAGRPVLQTYALGRLYAAVTLPEPLAPGACVTLEVPFVTRLPHRIGDSGRYNGDTTSRFGWFPQPRYRDRGVWSDGFVMTGFTHVTRFGAPAGDEVILGAERLGREGRYFLARADVPVRSIPFVASSRLTKHARKIDGVQVNVYTYSDAAIFDTSNGEAREKLEQMARILPFFRMNFGPYRHETLQIIESPVSNVGMAADGLILLGDMMFIYDRSWIAWGLFAPVGELTLAHELAHQWWGIGVGSDFDPENWLSESMAQTMMFAYSRARFGVDGLDYLDANWFVRWVVANSLGTALATNMMNQEVLPSYTDHLRFGIDGKVVGSQRERAHAEESAYLVYQKGALAVRGLMALLGESGLRATMRTIYAERAGDVITTDDLAAAALEVTGVSVAPYLNAFVRGLTVADLSIAGVATTASDAGFHTVVSLERKGDLALPAKVEVVTPGEHRLELWDTRAANTKLQFDTEERPTAVTVDPDAYVPDPNRTNNRWPEKRRFELFAPNRNADATTFSLNPLPIHRHYMAGLSFGGIDYEGDRFWTGAGVSGVGVDSNNQKSPYYAVATTLYGEAAMPVGRASQLSALVTTTYRRDRDNGDYSQAKVSVAHTVALYEETNVGYAGSWSMPRTTLTSELGAGAVAIPGDGATWSDSHAKNPELIREGAVPLVKLTLLRDETLKYGAAFELALAGGTNRSFAKGYGVTEAAVSYANIVPYVGRVSLVAHGFVGSPNVDPLYGRPQVRALPYTVAHDINPYDAAMDGGALLRLPFLKDRRIKNELTLGLLVFNDLSLDLHYGAARGTSWTSRGADVLRPWEDVGEVGAAAALGFGFLAMPFTISVGMGVPVWPSSPDWAKRGVFFRFGA
jgi:hypothetical protein